MLVWYRFAPFLLFFLTIAKFVLLIRYVLTPVKPDSAEYQIKLYDFGVQFWTSAAAGSADFLAFGLIYSWLTVTLHPKHSTDRKRTSFSRCYNLFFGCGPPTGSFDNWFEATITSMDTARSEYRQY